MYSLLLLLTDVTLRHSLPWIFVIADVNKPLLGADFLHHFHLSVDLNSRKLVDNTTHLSICGVLAPSLSLKPSLPPLPHSPNNYSRLLTEYPQLTQTHSYLNQPPKHSVTHTIATNESLLKQDALPLRDSTWRRGNFSTCWTWGLFALPRALGLPHSTWSLKNLATGDPVGTIDASTMLLCQTGTLFPSSMLQPMLSPEWISILSYRRTSMASTLETWLRRASGDV